MTTAPESSPPVLRSALPLIGVLLVVASAFQEAAYAETSGDTVLTACSGVRAGAPTTQTMESTIITCAQAIARRNGNVLVFFDQSAADEEKQQQEKAAEALIAVQRKQREYDNMMRWDDASFPRDFFKLDKTKISTSMSFNSEPGTDKEKYGLGITWTFEEIAIEEPDPKKRAAAALTNSSSDLRKFGALLLPDRINFQIEVKIKSDRTFLETERTKTDRFEIFPIAFTYTVGETGFKPYAKIGHSWSRTVSSNATDPDENKDTEDSTSWKAGISYKFDSNPWELDIGQTWRFEQLLSDKTSDDLEFAIKYSFD